MLKHFSAIVCGGTKLSSRRVRLPGLLPHAAVQRSARKQRRSFPSAIAHPSALTLAPHASVDQNDGMFLIALHKDVVPYGDPTETISWGYTVCDSIDEGRTMDRAHSHPTGDGMVGR